MQIAKTVRSIDRTYQGVKFTQETEISIITDHRGNYYVKSAGKVNKVSRESAQKYFQKNFNDFWKYVAINELYDQFPELYTREEALDIEKSYTNTPKKIIEDQKEKSQNYYEDFVG